MEWYCLQIMETEFILAQISLYSFFPNLKVNQIWKLNEKLVPPIHCTAQPTMIPVQSNGLLNSAISYQFKY